MEKIMTYSFNEWVQDKETKTYKISGPKEQLEQIDQLLSWIDYCCSVGHSATISLSVDGDGAASISVDGTNREKDIEDEDIEIGY